ncbi:MAG: hypothetical protein HY652_13535 [Acidobacteria bacterium]|nr:hypothetical protein [Acidobacteriota bacterium]
MLTLAHWIYLFFVVVILVSMVLRRDLVLICLVGMFAVAWSVTGSPFDGLRKIFTAIVVSSRELIDIILIVAVLAGLSSILRSVGAQDLMIAPLRRLVRSPFLAFWVVGLVMMVTSYFLYPSPATALVGAVLLPVATAVGMPVLYTASVMNIFGHGIALSTDYVIQGAPAITGRAANIPVPELMRAQIPLIATMSVVTLGCLLYTQRKQLKRASGSDAVATSNGPGAQVAQVAPVPSVVKFAAAVVPLAFAAALLLSILLGLRGGEATAALGGTALLLISFVSVCVKGRKSLDIVAESLVEGCVFSISIFTRVIVIAAFFYMGVPALSRTIFGESGRGLLFDLAVALSGVVPLNQMTSGLLQAFMGILSGLDGSGFSNLPLMGATAAAFGSAAHLNTAVLAALGQTVTIWVGGGCLVPWAVIPVAAICGVSPADLARFNWFPVLTGLAATTAAAVLLM